MQAQVKSTGIALLILNLGTTPWLLYPCEKAPVPLYGRLGGLQCWPGWARRIENLLLPLQFELRTFQPVASCTTLSWPPEWTVISITTWTITTTNFFFHVHNIENLPFVMIWLGSNDSSPSFSPKHAYSVRTLLLEKENKINVFKSKTGVCTLLIRNHTCDTENHAHGGLNKTRFHTKIDYFSTVAVNTCWHIFVFLMFYREWKIPHAGHQHAFMFNKNYTWVFLTHLLL